MNRARSTVSHVVYGGAHLFSAQSLSKLGALAAEGFSTYLPRPSDVLPLFEDAEAVAPFVDAIHAAVATRLGSTAPFGSIEDLRVDFEDGYGYRPSEEEDEHATAVGKALATLGEGPTTAALGVRVKRLSGATAARAERTLSRVFEEARRPMRVTFPKVESLGELARAGRLLDRLEAEFALPPKSCPLEMMAESPEVFALGISGLRDFRAAANGRPFAVHLGSYDLTASAGVPHVAQVPNHPILDHARTLLALAFGGSEVELSDGATTTLPIAPHRGKTPSVDEIVHNARVVKGAFRTHVRDVAHALRFGIYQSWVLHPMQLISLYVAHARFFVTALPDARARLSRFLEGEERASRVGAVFDDAATGRGLALFFERAAAFKFVSENDELLQSLRHRSALAEIHRLP